MNDDLSATLALLGTKARYLYREDAKVDFPAPVELQKLVMKIQEASVINPFNFREAIERLKRKIINGLSRQSNIYKLGITPDECCLLPFVVPDLHIQYATKGIAFLRDALVKSRYNWTIRRKTFQNLCTVYFSGFEKGPLFETIRRLIQQIMQEDQALSQCVPYVVQHPEFVEPDGVWQMGKHFPDGIQKYLNTIFWPISLRAGNFVHCAILSYFSCDVKTTTEEGIWTYVNRFDELLGNKVYSSILPRVVESLIWRNDAAQNSACIKKFKTTVLDLFGDPRNPSGSEWNQISKAAKRVFVSWLTEEDLEMFFRLISQTVKGTQENRRMWDAREWFWKRHVKEMKESRVFLGQRAAAIAEANHYKGYAAFTAPGDRDKSAIMFRIGDYVFIECSHNGRLRVWRNGTAPFNFYDGTFLSKAYDYGTVSSSPSIIQDFVHNVNWQKRVDDWIDLHCHE
ncbi:MAG: EH signature domain-containing protein [Succiniclasticum sp.]|jgi:hypothetical protein|nr:EH signature domain-containing protein [Succiniclasticum sp.]